MKEIAYNLKANYFKALGHPTRIKILEFLKDKEKCVCEIVPALKGKQANISQHLMVLKRVGLVVDRKEGLSVFYKVRNKKVFEVLDLISEMLRDYLKGEHKLSKVL